MSEIVVFNRRHLRQHRLRSKSAFHQHSFLFDWAGEQILDRLNDIKKDFPVTYSIGNRLPGIFWDKLKQTKKINQLVIHDILENNESLDSEILPFEKNSADLIISILELHTINDLPGLLLQARRALKPDGLFIACMLGGETLYELRETLMQSEIQITGGASPRVAPFADKPQTGDLLQRAGFALPVVDSEILRVAYQSIFNLMGDLRGMGESNALTARSKKFTPPALFASAAEYYQENFPDSEDKTRICASFELIFMIGWAPHESQQKPLRRGSAEHSLAEFLK